MRGWHQIAAFILAPCLKIYNDYKIQRSETPVVKAKTLKSQLETGTLHC